MTNQKDFPKNPQAKGEAKQFRLFALLSWVVAIGLEIYAILKLVSNQSITALIVVTLIILALAIIGNLLWRNANTLNPASEKDGFRFFVQNQLGAIIAAFAFLPLLFFIFTDKNASKQTKGIAAVVIVVIILITTITTIDFSSPSVEKYTEKINAQTNYLKKINFDNDLVYWSSEDNTYHILNNCPHITNKILSTGTIKQSWEEKGISELCKTCYKRASKQQALENDVALVDNLPDSVLTE